MRTIRLMMAATVAAVLSSGAAWAAGVENPVAPAANSDDQKIICKKTLEIGSLVKKNKQCFTKAEWERIAESQRTGAQKLARDLSGSCGQNGGVCP